MKTLQARVEVEKDNASMTKLTREGTAWVVAIESIEAEEGERSCEGGWKEEAPHLQFSPERNCAEIGMRQIFGLFCSIYIWMHVLVRVPRAVVARLRLSG